jgi:hypothetical protein
MTPDDIKRLKEAEVADAETEMVSAIRAWLNCSADKRPSARALGERIAQIAERAPSCCPECGGDGHFEEVAQGAFGEWEMQRVKCRACDGVGWLNPSSAVSFGEIDGS